MKTLDEIKQILRSQRPDLAERYGVTEIGVFGSYVQGEQLPESDLDILIKPERPTCISLLGPVDLRGYLSNMSNELLEFIGDDTCSVSREDAKSPRFFLCRVTPLRLSVRRSYA